MYSPHFLFFHRQLSSTAAFGNTRLLRSFCKGARAGTVVASCATGASKDAQNIATRATEMNQLGSSNQLAIPLPTGVLDVKAYLGSPRKCHGDIRYRLTIPGECLSGCSVSHRPLLSQIPIYLLPRAGAGKPSPGEKMCRDGICWSRSKAQWTLVRAWTPQMLQLIFFFFPSFPANAVSAGWRNVLNEMEKSQVWQKCVPVTARICP